MRDIDRIQRITNLLNQIWLKLPDFRFTQLIDNISWGYNEEHGNKYIEYSYSKWEENDQVVFKKDMPTVDLFYVEDDSLEKYLEKYLSEL